MNKPSSSTDILRAQTLNRAGLEHYERWEMETAITLFQEAIRLDDQQPDYYLNLARSHVRMGDYDYMLQALGNYLHIEKDVTLINRFQTLFSNALDDVEELLTTTMRAQGVRLEVIGAAILRFEQYGSLGRRPRLYRT